MGRRFAYLLMLLCLPVLPVLAADALVESRLSFRRFTTIDGLPQMQTEAVWQDTRGYIWIGTLSGFVRCDGRQVLGTLNGKVLVDGQTLSDLEGQFYAPGEIRSKRGFRFSFFPIFVAQGMYV